MAAPPLESPSSPSASPSGSAKPPVPKLAPHRKNASDSSPPHSTSGSGTLSKTKSTSSKVHTVPILAGVIGGAVFLIFSSIGIYLCKTKVANVRPWAMGLSGQLQKAFVTGKSKHFFYSKLTRVNQGYKQHIIFIMQGPTLLVIESTSYINK